MCVKINIPTGVCAAAFVVYCKNYVWKFDVWGWKSFADTQLASGTTVIILLQLSAGEAEELAPNETDYRRSSQIKETLMDHVNLSAGFDPTNDLLINTMLS